jgi:hypothetical protein
LKKNLVLALAILAAGWLLRSVDSISAIQLAKWSLGQLISWSSFSIVGVMAAATAPVVGSTLSRPVLQSVGASRLAGAALVGLALWMLSLGAKSVLVAAWLPTLQKTLAVATVAIVGYAVWVLYTRFEDVSAAIRRLGPAATPSAAVHPLPQVAASSAPAPALDSAFCGKCGAAVPSSNPFCGRCGAAVPRQ